MAKNEQGKPVTQVTQATQSTKDRYRAGVLPYAQMGYWDPDYQPKDTDVLAGSRRDPPQRPTRAHPAPAHLSRAFGDDALRPFAPAVSARSRVLQEQAEAVEAG